MPAQKKKYKLDIFKLLDNLSTKNINYYNSLSEEEQKAISPLVVMRWLSGTVEARQIYFLNELVNPFVFVFSKHKQLLINLMIACASGKKYRYSYNKTTTITKYPKTIEVIKEYFKYSKKDSLEVLPVLTNDNIISFAEQLGRQPPEITVIKRELKARVVNERISF